MQRGSGLGSCSFENWYSEFCVWGNGDALRDVLSFVDALMDVSFLINTWAWVVHFAYFVARSNTV
jgi:hypothetical protein